ncbi:response regulator transcription factor [Thiothrix nivea]|uniref:Two component transcriptional regulator, winged helix family n=1 Tax=Thiothrix nivea (strain ATCC 35100 / DSM 5205 / JP2) TaxID=870187 RepID=A0A656HLC1_THINJ|nr:response regulator transcription factor [Thiothrix nivea]EIJ36316.1 two component transcriptional regulator, winged helix family [Thiothrix nivea DSM 5205]
MNSITLSDTKVALVDDDKVTRILIGSALREHKVTVLECGSAEELFALLQTQKVDVIILDLVLPKVNGLDALTYLREHSDVGVIMISSRASAEQRLNGLREGADDFIDKPVVAAELVFKVKSLAMRVNTHRGQTNQQQLTIGNSLLLVDEYALVRTDKTERCTLTDAEQRILVSLVQNGAGVCTRKSLLQCVSRTDTRFGNERSVDTLVSRLRTKLGKLGCDASINPVRGQGYRLQVE